ncbi:MAG: hypothetical protein AB1689_19855 [Thermodesulfobacteriota bacterium]
MDATQRKLVALAREGDMQLRSAAILVLAELGCDEPAAIEAVAAALESGNAVLQEFGLAYAEKVRDDALLPAIVPFVAAPQSPARERAERILADAGATAVAAAAALLPKLERRKRGPVAAWMAQQQGKRSRDALVRLLGSSDGEAVREAAQALVAASAQADDSWRIAVAGRLAARLGDEALRADEPTCLALLDLAATLARPELRKALLELARASSGRVRSTAVRALGAAVHQVKPSAAEQRFVAGLLEDADLATLERGTFPIAERLRRVRILGPEELFYVAFNLAEQPGTRGAAAELLRQIVKQSPRTKMGKAARNKLALLERGGGLAAAAP